MKLIGKKEFARAAMDKNIEAFVMHMTFLSLSLMLIHPAKKTEIVLLLAKKIKISAKYSDFSYVILEEKALVLSKITNLN